MMKPIPLVFLVALASSSVKGQDILHYKFESGSGALEVNYGDPVPGVPRIAQIVTNSTVLPSQGWGPGKFGGGLASGPTSPSAGVELDTGWDNVVGEGVDVTVAFFFKAVYPLPSNSGAQFCAPDSGGAGIHMGISGVPSTFGRPQLTWSPGPADNAFVMLAQDVLTPAFSDWVHLAVVITRSGQSNCQTATAQWFVNGVPQIPQAPTSCFHDLPGTSLHTFRFGQTGEAYFRYDDVRVSLRAVPAAEIQQWATTDKAGGASFGDACYPFGTPVQLWGSGGSPTPGNASHTLTVYGLPGSFVYLGFGLSDTTYAGSPLPLSLGFVSPSLSGCLLRVSPDYLVTGTTTAAGSCLFPMPIPAGQGFVGLDAYAQAVLYSAILGQWSATNAWAVHVGN